jgi:hypothetical protein
MKIMVVTHAGILTQYNLRPHGPAPGPDVDPKTLQLTVEPTFYWDVCRRSGWAQLLTRVKSKKDEPIDGIAPSKSKEKDPRYPVRPFCQLVAVRPRQPHELTRAWRHQLVVQR